MGGPQAVRFWLPSLAAAAVGALLGWAQMLGSLKLGVLAFDRGFGAGADNDWLLNYRNALWLCATAVIIAVLATRMVFSFPGSWSRGAAVSAAALLGVSTVVPFLRERASSAQDVDLVEQPSDSVTQAVIVGVVLGAVMSVIVGMRAGSARALAVGAIAGAAVLWILLAVSANAIAIGPPVLGVLELGNLGFDARANVMQATALLMAPAIAALVSLLARRETTSSLIVAGLLSASSVAATIVVTAIVGPAPSGDHIAFGTEIIAPVLVGGVLAFGLLATVARSRRRKSPSVSAV